LEQEKKSGAIIYPPENNIYSFTRFTPLSSVKVIILGQDPYHGPNQAHGLCFSVQDPTPPPPSLINIYKELENDIEGFKSPNHGNLTSWAQQGVLLLNTSLTVRKGSPASHSTLGWEIFTDKIITYLGGPNSKPGKVFILWGGHAQKKGKVIDRVNIFPFFFFFFPPNFLFFLSERE